MSLASFQKPIATAEEALRSFIATLLNKEAVFEIDDPAIATIMDAKSHALTLVTMLNPGEGDTAFAIMLDPAWVGLFSEAMLGAPMELADDGAEDLMREMTGQGYGSIRNALSPEDITLPEATFDILGPGMEIPDGALADALVGINFTTTVGEATLAGKVFFSASVSLDAPAQAAPQAAPQPAMAPTQQPMAQPAMMPQQPVTVQTATFPELGMEAMGVGGDNFNLLAEVELEVTVELGRRKLPLADVLRLTTGSVIELENLVGEPLEVYANGRLIAEGEAVVIDEQFGIRITRLASARHRTKAFL